MSGQFTAGPWRATTNGYGCHFVQAGETGLICGGNNHDTLTEANADLISAAPDMLDALNLALKYWADRQQRYRNRSPVWVQAARAAIAKAKALAEVELAA